MSFGLGFGFPKRWSSISSAPTLSLNFVGANALPANLTFSRTTVATQFDSLGRLVWAPMNLVARPNDLSSASWTRTDTTITLNPTSFSAGYPTYVVTEGSAGTAQTTSSAPFTITASAPLTVSIYCKADSVGDWVRIVVADTALGPNGANLWVNLRTRVLGGFTARGTGTAIASGIQLLNDGWMRVYATVTCGTAATAAIAWHSTSTDGGTVRVSGAKYVLGSPQAERTGVDSPKPYVYDTVTPSAAYYGPRFDYSPATFAARGLLVEESRTNSVVNSTMVGGTAPSTIPTGWNITAVTGLTITYAYGTEDGIPYIDVTYSGTNTSGADAFPTIFAGAIAGVVAAANGQTWTGSLYVRKIAGTTAISTINYFVRGRASGALVPGQASSVALADSAKLTTGRTSATFTFTDPTITHVEQVLSATVANGAAYDITLRIGGPQLEQGQIATSPIPTYGAAATRGGDQVSVTGTNFSAWYNQAGGTVVCAGTVSTPDLTNARRWWDISDGTASNRIQQVRASGGTMLTQGVSTVAGVSDFAPVTAGSIGSFQYSKAAYMFSAAGKRIVRDNGAVASNVVVPPTSGMTQMVIGGLVGFVGGNCFNGWIGSIAYYPRTDFTDAQLQALTV